MTPIKLSDYDIVALKRMSFAHELLMRDDVTGAVDIYTSITQDWPDYAPAWFELGRVTGEDHYFDAYLARDPADQLGAGVLRAAKTVNAPDRAPAEYVEALFDDYAPRFEEALLERLDYQVPQRLAQMLAPYGGSDVLDLGCGTGLMGAALEPRPERLIGVDLSSLMLEEAAQKSIYTELHSGEIHHWLSQSSEMFDMILAADVFSYIGALSEVISGCADRLRAGGILGFTVEASEDDREWYMRQSRRYAHSQDYITTLLSAAGFAVNTLHADSLRRDRGRDIMGYYVIATRAGGSI